ncbi:MAG: aldolase/citrate lyase family protein [Chloroflexota bacterium]
MRHSKVVSKLHDNRPARMCGLGHFLPFFVNYAAHFKFDGIWLDLEHRAWDDREVQAILALAHAKDIDIMLRPSTIQRTRLYRYLEDGATGFMIPFVDDAEKAQYLVDTIKYPPLGNRGLDGAGLDANFGLDTWIPNSTYIEDANRETFIVAQIETPQAVANAAEIAAVPGIDVIFVGPGDLGLRLEADPAISMTLDEAVEKVAAAAEQHGKAWGRTAGTVEELERYHKMGAQMVPWGGDFALMTVLKNCSQELDTVLQE